MFVDDEEIRALILNLAETRGEMGFTDVEVRRIVDMFTEARVMVEAFELAVDKMVSIDVDVDGEVIFRKVVN